MSPTRPFSSKNTVDALAAQALFFDIGASYSKLMNDLVFKKDINTTREDKLILHYRRTLLSLDSRNILSIVWKESEYVKVEELIAAGGMSKWWHPRELTSYSLATELATSPNDVAKLNSRVRQIVIAANVFGLVDRVRVSSTRIQITGTEALHTFMLEMCAETQRAVSTFLKRTSYPSMEP